MSDITITPAVEGKGLGLWSWEPKQDRFRLSPNWAITTGVFGDGAPVPIARWKALIHPDDRARWQGAIDAQRRGRDAGYQLEYRIRFQSLGGKSSWHWVQERGANQRGTLAGVHLDLTPLKDAEADLKDGAELFGAVFATARDGIVTVDPADLSIISFNDAACAMLSYRRAAFSGLSLTDLAAGGASVTAVREVAQKGGGNIELSLRRPNGPPLTIDARFRLIHSEGRPRLVGIWSLSDEQRRAALALCGERLAVLFDNPVFGVAELGADGQPQRVNSYLASLVQQTPEALADGKFTQFVRSRDPDQDKVNTGQLLAGEIGNYRSRRQVVGADGKKITTDWTLSLLRDPEKKPMGFLAVVEDLRARQLLNLRVMDARALSSRLLETVEQAVLVCRPMRAGDTSEFEIQALNPAAQRLLGRNEPELVGRGLFATLPNFCIGDLPGAMAQLDHRHAPQIEAILPELPTKAGEDAHAQSVDVRRCLVTVAATKTRQVLLLLKPEADMAEQTPSPIQGQLTHDALTGLPGLGLFQDRVLQAAGNADAKGETVAVCCLDLDDFKGVNELHGRDTGDAVLKQVAGRLREQLAPTDTAACWGGDDFGLLLTGLDSIERCTERLQAILETVATPFRIGPRTIEITASIGVALYPGDREQAADMVRYATQALQHCQKDSPGGFQFMDMEADGIATAYRERLDRVQQTLALDQLALYVQPIVDLASGRPVAAEVLLRWSHPEQGVLGADSVLPGKSGAHLMRRIDLWVLDHALPVLERWVEQGMQLKLHVNISGATLIHGGFIQVLRMLLDAYPLVPPEKLVFEVQESAAESDLDAVGETIRAGQALGVSFALDDFGTGATSMTYFRELSAQLLKIDQSFVRDMVKDREARSIVTALAGVAHGFGRTALAVGIESIDHAKALSDIGCNLGQGFGIAEPMPMDDLPAWLDNWKLPDTWSAAVAGD